MDIYDVLSTWHYVFWSFVEAPPAFGCCALVCRPNMTATTQGFWAEYYFQVTFWLADAERCWAMWLTASIDHSPKRGVKGEQTSVHKEKPLISSVLSSHGASVLCTSSSDEPETQKTRKCSSQPSRDAMCVCVCVCVCFKVQCTDAKWIILMQHWWEVGLIRLKKSMQIRCRRLHTSKWRHLVDNLDQLRGLLGNVVCQFWRNAFQFGAVIKWSAGISRQALVWTCFDWPFSLKLQFTGIWFIDAWFTDGWFTDM